MLYGAVHGLTAAHARRIRRAMQTIDLNLDGFTDLPAGKIANIATCLQMFAIPETHQPRAAPPGFSLQPLAGSNLARYRALFRAVGEPWLWFSRLCWDDARLAATLDDPDVEAFALSGPNGDAGILEFDFRVPGDVELAFFGLVPDAVGSGLGRYLMAEAVTRAFARGPRRFWVHTCTLDHPAALPFYRKAGFVPWKRQIEVADDPRLCGIASPQAAPHIPLIAAADER